MTTPNIEQVEMQKLELELEKLGETLQNASMPYGASLVMKAISAIRSLEQDHKAMKERAAACIEKIESIDKEYPMALESWSSNDWIQHMRSCLLG